MTPSLRPYQEQSIERLRASYASGHRAPLYCLPTGGGKTRVAAAIIASARSLGRRVLFGVGRTELLDQSESKLRDAGVSDFRVIQADRDDGPRDSLVTLASIPTLVTERWSEQLPDADLVVIDEAHHVMASTWNQLAKKYASSALLGLTASPQRGDKRALGDMFDDLVVGATVSELVALGHLAASRVYAPTRIMGPRELALDPVDAFERYVPAKTERAIVFAQTRAHARAISDSFRARGYTSDSVDALTRDRRGVLARFSSGEIQVLASVAVLVEGFDDPGVSVAILARRFTHPGSYIQAGGRVLRPHPGKQLATLIDLCGSAIVHGPLDLDREYSLSGAGIGKPQTGSVRHCTKCGGVYLSSARTECIYCGHAMPVLARTKPKSLAEQLHEVTKDFESRDWNVRSAKGSRICRDCGALISNGAKYAFVRGGPSLHVGCVFAQAKARELAERAKEEVA